MSKKRNKDLVSKQVNEGLFELWRFNKNNVIDPTLLKICEAMETLLYIGEDKYAECSPEHIRLMICKGDVLGRYEELERMSVDEVVEEIMNI